MDPLRLGHAPARFGWRLGHLAVSRAVAAYLLRGVPEATVYTAGSGESGELVAGLSDVDLVLVIGGAPGEVERARALTAARWRLLRHRFPRLSHGLSLAIYGERDLDDEDGGTCLTYGLGEDGLVPAEVGYLRQGRPADELYRRIHPGIYGPGRTWRRLHGTVRTRAEPVQSLAYRRIAGWLELQWWWRFAFEMCTSTRPDFAAYLAFKLVAEPARIWLWLAQGERVTGRREALERMLRLLPEEEDVLRQALSLYDELPRAGPPRAETLDWLLRAGDRIAALLEAELRGHSATDVMLETESELLLPRAMSDPVRELASLLGSSRLLPLVDWRARAMPPMADESLALIVGDAADPDIVAAAARASVPGLQTAVRVGRLLVLPNDALSDRVLLRSVQCALTDPVSFALVEGRSSATFPDVPGWSALDSARRAVAEHGAWLAGWTPDGPAPDRALDLLLTAARAALFLDSICAGHPMLPLTAAATVAHLADAQPAVRSVSESALDVFREARATGLPAESKTVGAFREVVEQLPGFAGRRQRR